MLNTKKFTANLDNCNAIGQNFAAKGKTLASVNRWLVASGYSLQGLTAQRVRNAYRRQVAKG